MDVQGDWQCCIAEIFIIVNNYDHVGALPWKLASEA